MNKHYTTLQYCPNISCAIHTYQYYEQTLHYTTVLPQHIQCQMILLSCPDSPAIGQGGKESLQGQGAGGRGRRAGDQGIRVEEEQETRRAQVQEKKGPDIQIRKEVWSLRMGEGEGLVTRVVGGAGRTAGDLVRVTTLHVPFSAFLNLYHIGHNHYWQVSLLIDTALFIPNCYIRFWSFLFSLLTNQVPRTSILSYLI